MSEQSRRTVRATPGFFADLDSQLPSEAGPTGVPPSRSDFQAYDLLPIVERFATGFDDLPEPIPGRPDYRILITRGRLVLSTSVIGQLASDGVIELLELDIDIGGAHVDDLEGDSDG